MIPVLVFTLCCFVVHFTRWFVLSLTLCYFVLVFFSPFSIAIISLGEERASLGDFRTFVRFAVFVCFLFLLESGKGCGLWLWHSLDFSLTLFSNDDPITKTCLFKHTENFTTKKWHFQIKHSDSLHISAQNIDCGYSWEPPRQGSSNKYP